MTTSITSNASDSVLKINGADAVKFNTGGVTSKILSITASVASNALTITLNPTVLDFRSSSLTSGTVNTRLVNSSISVVVSSGSTLGTVNAVQSRLAVLAIDNAGTVELAVVNMSGGNQLDETNLITTVAEGGAGGADSANVIYSTTARTNVPYRVVGYVESTQATAGTWVTSPSTIQGYGGQALAALSSLGYGQTWQNVTSSRANATTYYNTTGKPILVSITQNVPGLYQIALNINGYNFLGMQISSGSVNVTGIVPVGQFYSVSAGATLTAWAELR